MPAVSISRAGCWRPAPRSSRATGWATWRWRARRAPGTSRSSQALLEQGAAIDARNLEGSTALLLAAENERQATVGFLLAKGADPNLPGRVGRDAARRRGVQGQRPHRRTALERGADPNVVDKTGKAAVTYAAARGFTEVVRRLLDAGVDAKRATAMI